MNVINRLVKAGLTVPQIAAATGAEPPTVRSWRAGRRFPSRRSFEQLVKLGEGRGLLFTADDFIAVEPENEDDA